MTVTMRDHRPQVRPHYWALDPEGDEPPVDEVPEVDEDLAFERRREEKAWPQPA